MRKNQFADKTDPFVNYKFRVEIDGIEMMGFTKVSELSNETSVFSYKEGGMNSIEHKLPEATTFNNITLEHGLGLGNEIHEWRESVIQGKMEEALKDGIIKLYSENNTTIMWHFYGAWPCKLNISDLDGNASNNGEVVIESVELVIESFEKMVGTDSRSTK